MSHLRLFLILLTINEILLDSNYITLSFQRKNSKNIKLLSQDQQIYQNLVVNNVYSMIKTGTPLKQYEIELKFQQYTTFLSDKTSYISNPNIVTYNSLISQSYKPLNNESRNFTNIEFSEGIRAIDLFKFEDKEIKEFYFIYVTKLIKDISTAGVLGLKIKDDSINELKQTNFITQLKKNKLINSYAFTIKYKNLEEGEIIIGENIDSLIHSEKNNFQKTNVELDDFSPSWKLKFSKITYGDYLIEQNKKINLELEFGLIIASENFRLELQKNFFDEKLKNKECSMGEFIDLSNQLPHIFYKCNKKTNLKNFKVIKFYNDELNMNFTFETKDLFKELNNYLYFQMIFDKNQIYSWKFGKIFFSKYQLYFDQDKKIIGVLKSFKLGNSEKFAWTLVIIFGLGLIGMGYLSYRIFILLPRRKRANELKDDFYDYSSQTNYTELSKPKDNNKNLGINN